MKILIYGAGVLGTLYAAGLHGAGENVTLLARGERLRQVRDYGLVLENASTREWTFCHVPVVERLEPNDDYDLVMILTRKDQLCSILPALSCYHGSATILFMQISLSGYRLWNDVVGQKRLLIGYPGAGGKLEGHVVHYCIAPGWYQPTTIGELHCTRSRRTREIARVISNAGFPVAISSDISAWQKSHTAWISPLANALYVTGNGHLLSRRSYLIRLMLQATREGFEVLHTLGVKLTPLCLRVLKRTPDAILVPAVERLVNTEFFRVIAEAHALSAVEEMQMLSSEFKELALRSSVPTPAIDTLASYAVRSSAAAFARDELRLVA